MIGRLARAGRYFAGRGDRGGVEARARPKQYPSALGKLGPARPTRAGAQREPSVGDRVGIIVRPKLDFLGRDLVDPGRTAVGDRAEPLAMAHPGLPRRAGPAALDDRAV